MLGRFWAYVGTNVEVIFALKLELLPKQARKQKSQFSRGKTMIFMVPALANTVKKRVKNGIRSEARAKSAWKRLLESILGPFWRHVGG